MDPASLNKTTEIIGHGRFLFLRLPAGEPAAALGEALEGLGEGMENMHEAEGPPSKEASARGRYQILRAEPSMSLERDLPHPELTGADVLVRIEASASAPLEKYEAGLRGWLEGRGGAVESLTGVQRPRSYTSYAMTQYAYAAALAPQPADRCPFGVVTPQNKTADWWAMDWMRRESFFLPRYDEAGNIIAKGHSLVSDAAIPCVTRRLIHAPGGYEQEGVYDFVGYFEFAEADAETFRAVMAGLRDVKENPEWAYVLEGPEWWGRRVARLA